MIAIDLSRAVWRTSTYSGQNGNCIEVTSLGPATAVRDSKYPDGPKLIIAPGAWRKFTDRVKAEPLG